MIEFQGSIDEKLYVRVLRLQLRGLFVFAVIWMIAAVLALVGATADPRSWIIPVAFLSGGIYVFVGPRWWARKGLKAGKMLAAPFKGSADEEHFVLESSFGRSDIPWPMFHQVMVAPDLVLLYPQAQQCYVLTPRFFASAEEWQRFCELVRRLVPPRKSGLLAGRGLILWIVIIILVVLLWSLFRSGQ